MKNIGILEEIQHAADKAGKHAHTGAEAVRDQEQGHHRTDRDASSLRHVKEAELLKQNRQGG